MKNKILSSKIIKIVGISKTLIFLHFVNVYNLFHNIEYIIIYLINYLYMYYTYLTI